MINLWYEDFHLPQGMNGPRKLLINLKESLLDSDIPFSVNSEQYKINFLIHYDQYVYPKHEKLEHNNCFIGPQLWPFDNYGKFLIENPSYCNKIIVPSECVKNLLLLKFGVNESKVSVWPVGIKESNLNINVKYDCLLYSKRRNVEEISKAIDFLESKNLSYNVISYGAYSESDFELMTCQSRFCFLVNGSESQGIAVQEMMSSNVPLFVWDVSEWNDQGEEYKVPCSSVPYWDETCGEKFYHENEMEETFSKFCDKISSYRPREFVEKNLSYKRSIEILMEILNVN